MSRKLLSWDLFTVVLRHVMGKPNKITLLSAILRPI